MREHESNMDFFVSNEIVILTVILLKERQGFRIKIKLPLVGLYQNVNITVKALINKCCVDWSESSYFVVIKEYIMLPKVIKLLN